MGGGSVFVVGFGGNGWDVPVLVACILACFIIAASTPVLLVLYVRSHRMLAGKFETRLA